MYTGTLTGIFVRLLTCPTACVYYCAIYLHYFYSCDCLCSII